MKFLASLLFLAVVLWPSSSCTQNLGSDQKQLETMVVELYQAMIAKDRNTLEKLTAETLSYGHSSGTLENKAAYIEAILNGPFEFLSIDPANQTISVSGDTAIVRHIFNAKGKNNGENVDVHIGVILVFQKHTRVWKLIARQAYKL